ncbi:hypothetical protein OV450_0877 [Actinobacteria bacterium OV450]|nr:hypothetical protein OV450_0877 [Actinobacteria bacterium OV450]
MIFGGVGLLSHTLTRIGPPCGFTDRSESPPRMKNPGVHADSPAWRRVPTP